ncbi:MAG: type I restriction enzyme subunit R domain-containing protein, partial [Phototrophicaceae bacterium]
DLRYEARDIEQHLSSPDKVDHWFETKTAGLTEHAKAQIKAKWGTMQNVLSARRRLERIVEDIIIDMEMRQRLKDGRGNALLVAGSIYEACKFYEIFLQRRFTQCAIITSYDPQVRDVKGETTGSGKTEAEEKYAIYQQMLNGKSVEQFEAEVKRQFIESPAQMRLLIVVDKLLTGFDAPAATYLYIDKQMRDHNLFQAICRVNRLDGEDKEYGYIVDYKDLFKSLEQSMQDYTAGALDGFDREDVAGLLKDRVDSGLERLEVAREQIALLCEPVQLPKDILAYIHFFCGDEDDKRKEQRRQDLYKYTTALSRAYINIANDLPRLGYTPKQIQQLEAEVTHYESIRNQIKLASGDAVDLKQYEPDMRRMLDLYIQADESQAVTELAEIPLLTLIVQRGKTAVEALPPDIRQNPEAVAETIENNVRRAIVQENHTNEAHYDRMSKLLNALIEQRQQQALDYEAYLEAIIDLAKQVQNPETATGYPASMDTRGKKALFELLKDEAIVNQVHNAVIRTKKHSWRDDIMKEREIQAAIYMVVKDHDRTSVLFAILKNQQEY